MICIVPPWLVQIENIEIQQWDYPHLTDTQISWKVQEREKERERERERERESVFLFPLVSS